MKDIDEVDESQNSSVPQQVPLSKKILPSALNISSYIHLCILKEDMFPSCFSVEIKPISSIVRLYAVALQRGLVASQPGGPLEHCPVHCIQRI